MFGGLDGIITTFSTIASVAGGSLPVEVVITLGFANLIADGISMGVGDGLSSKAEYDFIMSERKREEWEFDNHPEGEVEEMVEILREKGFDEGDAREIIETMATQEHKGAGVRACGGGAPRLRRPHPPPPTRFRLPFHPRASADPSTHTRFHPTLT